MSTKLALRLRGVSKAYRIATAAPRHTTLAEMLMWRLRHPLQRSGSEELWAVRDISFDLTHGQVIGVIGRNGAGKSTLLKLLSRITQPDRGRIELYGKVGSLLEVGTGFHPELTGRENIYLNGGILGMRRHDIEQRFDDIVSFAGVERFLDTPVKRYSSGMYVRLAFAVAAHLTSDILVVDEVLAVGDAQFQRRCLGRMKEVAGSGRTVLFVSHAMQAISALCQQVMYLEAGQMKYFGPVAEGVQYYLNQQGMQDITAALRRSGSGEVRFTDLGCDRQTYLSTDDIAIDMEMTAMRPGPPSYFVSIEVTNGLGTVVLHLDSRQLNWEFPMANRRRIRYRIYQPRLAQGDYSINAYLCHTGGVMDRHEGAARFTIAPILPYPCARGDCAGNALVYPEFTVEERADTPEREGGCEIEEMDGPGTTQQLGVQCRR